MTYCNLVERTESYAIYAWGVTTANMTGEVKFVARNIEPEYIRFQDVDDAGITNIEKVAVKHKNNILSGFFLKECLTKINKIRIKSTFTVLFLCPRRDDIKSIGIPDGVKRGCIHFL